MLATAVILVLLLVGLLWVLPVVMAVRIADRKHLGGGWLWGLALGWIGVWVLMAQPTPRQFTIGPGTVVASPELKKCPQCAELVRSEAKVCRFCKHNF